MSTILRALDKDRSDRDRDGDPEAILARNATFREALRRKRPFTSSQRKTLILSSLSLILALFCVVAITWSWFREPSSRGNRADSGAAGGGSGGVTAEPTFATKATPFARSAQTGGGREVIRLRTRPLIRPSVAPGSRQIGNAMIASTNQGYVSTQTGGPPPQPVAAVVATPAPLPAAPKATVAEKQPASDDPNDFLSLSGILLDPKAPTALISNKILGVGETIQGVKILAIDNHSYVLVEYRGKKHNLVLK